MAKAGAINNPSAPIPPTASSGSSAAQTLQALGTDYCVSDRLITGQEYVQEVAMRRTHKHNCADLALCIYSLRRFNSDIIHGPAGSEVSFQ